MPDYPRGRRLDMEWGDIPTDLILTSEDTIENSHLARQIKLVNACNKAFKCKRKIHDFLASPVQAHANNTPLDMAYQNICGLNTSMRLLKKARGLSC